MAPALSDGMPSGALRTENMVGRGGEAGWPWWAAGLGRREFVGDELGVSTDQLMSFYEFPLVSLVGFGTLGVVPYKTSRLAGGAGRDPE